MNVPEDGLYNISINEWQGWGGRRPRIRSLRIDGDVPFPSPGDALYVLMYPVMMAGLLLLVRRRNAGMDRNGIVDGLILGGN